MRREFACFSEFSAPAHSAQTAGNLPFRFFIGRGDQCRAVLINRSRCVYQWDFGPICRTADTIGARIYTHECFHAAQLLLRKRRRDIFTGCREISFLCDELRCVTCPLCARESFTVERVSFGRSCRLCNFSGLKIIPRWIVISTSTANVVRYLLFINCAHYYHFTNVCALFLYRHFWMESNFRWPIKYSIWHQHGARLTTSLYSHVAIKIIVKWNLSLGSMMFPAIHRVPKNSTLETIN